MNTTGRVQRRKIFKGFSTLNNNTDILDDIELIKVDLINHFHTRKRERVMYPEFGCIIWDLLFDSLTASDIEDIRDDCRQIVESDPRLTFIQANVSEGEHTLVVQVEIEYNQFNLTENLSLSFDKTLSQTK